MKVGVISDGANNWTDAQALGDLPVAGITQYGTCTKAPADEENCVPEQYCNEGTAMAEIIHDIAPGAQIAVGAVSTSLEFIQRISDLSGTFGADIIVDDLGFYNEPYFEDGDIADAVAAVVDQLVYVSSAGNSATNHHEAMYLDWNPSSPSDNLHDFGTRAGDSPYWALPVYAEQYGLAYALLQWNDRFGQSSNDYDLYADIYNYNTNEYLGTVQSIGTQDGSQDPFEATGICNSNDFPVWAFFYVNPYSAASRDLEIFVRTNAHSVVVDYDIPFGSVFGHPAVPDALAVGAVDASDTGHDTIEGFSSQGPSVVYFPSFESRPKPDLTGIDGVSVTGVGGFPSLFFGTSAAAPHVAGIAALLKQAMPSASPSEIRSALRNGAVDLGSSGRDDIFGEGRTDGILAEALLDTDRDGILNGNDDDDDGDRLTDEDELENGLLPLDPDTDGDGIDDGLDAEPLLSDNECVGSEATFAQIVTTQITCGAQTSITAIPPAEVQDSGHLRLIAPQVGLESGFRVRGNGRLSIISMDPCTACGP